MDSSQDAPVLSDFNEKDKKELQTFLESERQKAKFQENVHHLTALCWTKCIKGKISSPTIDRTESACLANCVNRFIDTQQTIITNLEAMGDRG